jgi:hypothetical protein
MITRDPLKVPYKTDRYWVTYPNRDAERIERFERTVLSRGWTTPLPHVSNLTTVEALKQENDNLGYCSEYARNILKV